MTHYPKLMVVERKLNWQKGFSELLAEWRKDTNWKALWETANGSLPYDLVAQGYDFYVAWTPNRDRDYFAAALVKDWRVEREWDYIPNLTEIFELVKGSRC